MRQRQRFFGLVLGSWLSWTGIVRADVVTDWNVNALTVIGLGAATRPTPSGRAR